MYNTVVSTQEYDMTVELLDGVWFFHTNVHKWNSGVKKKYLEDLKSVGNVFKPLYAIPEEVSDKMTKFGKVVGFVPVEYVECLDNKVRPLFKLKENIDG